MDPRAAFAAVDRLREVSLADLRRLVAVPSVSAAGEHLEECAELVAELAAGAGFQVERWPTPGAPIVYAHLPGPPGSPTVLFYGHYDVQPPEPLEAWDSPPFSPTLRDGALYGRGAADNKGQFLAHIVAARALQDSGGCPVTVKLLVEGEEEIGSPHLEGTVRRHRRALACDLALTADGPYHDDGRPVIIFGVRGLLYLEVEARGADRDVHSGNRGGLVPSAAWALVHALASLRDAAGRVRIPGFADGVRPPTAAERRLMEELPADREALAADLGLQRLPLPAGVSPWEAVMFRPTLNICGLASGYAGPGSKTIVPCRAVAKIDVRLVPDQEPDAVEAAIRAHLREAGHDLRIRRLGAVPPSSTPTETPWAEPVGRGLEAAAGVPPWRRPRLGGTTPDYVFTRVLRVPSLLIPYAPPDMNNHAPNERMSLEALERGIRSSAAICLALGAAGRPTP